MPTATKKAKTSSLHTRVDDSIRQDAENILHGMGISMSQYVNMSLYQLHIKRKIPFEIEAEFPQSVYDKLDEIDANRANIKYMSLEECFANWDKTIAEVENGKI